MHKTHPDLGVKREPAISDIGPPELTHHILKRINQKASKANRALKIMRTPLSENRTLVVALEHRFYEVDGVPSTRLAFSYDYWCRFLAEFDKVVILARLERGAHPSGQEVTATGPGVTFEAMPFYVGPLGFFRKLPKLLRVAWRTACQNKHFLLRSGNVATLLWICLMLQRKPYIREYPGNTKEGIINFTGGGSLAIKAAASISHWLSRKQGRFARACSYVSNDLRKIYPARSSKLEFVFSSARLVAEVPPKSSQRAEGLFRIASLGRLEKEKGHETLLKAVSRLSADMQVSVDLIGDGSQRRYLTSLAENLGIDATFHGTMLDKHRLYSLLRSSDLFVLPSLTEGMPRALIEAMSIKVPCIASSVGGVPEIIDKRFMVAPGDSEALAKRIAELAYSEELRSENASVHHATVQEKFSPKVTEAAMRHFWSFA